MGRRKKKRKRKRRRKKEKCQDVREQNWKQTKEIYMRNSKKSAIGKGRADQPESSKQGKLKASCGPHRKHRTDRTGPRRKKEALGEVRTLGKRLCDFQGIDGATADLIFKQISIVLNDIIVIFETVINSKF